MSEHPGGSAERPGLYVRGRAQHIMVRARRGGREVFEKHAEKHKKTRSGAKKTSGSLAVSRERRNFALAFGTEVPGGKPQGVVTPRKAPRFAGVEKK